MNKILSINYLVATLAIVATLISCRNSNNSAVQNDNQANQLPVEAPKNEAPSAAMTAVIEQQEDETPKTADDEPLAPEVLKEAYQAPKELKYYRETEDLYEKFYPIGWSKDGHFAYVLEPPDEAAGMYFFKFVIRNMISDKEVYSWEPEDELETGSVRQVWKENNMLFAEKLNQYKIIADKNIELQGTEFQANGNKYKVTIENKMETDPDYGFEVVKTTNLHIKSPELGTKQIYSYTENDYNLCLGRMVLGVIKSPYENRVAVLMKSENRGYEGTPYVIKLTFVGSDLERSFKK